MNQPDCPRCGLAPTTATVPMDEARDAWQDVCDKCAAKATKQGVEVVPLEINTDSEG